MVIKTQQGLGDAVYSWPIIRYFIEKFGDVGVITKFPEIFRNLKCKIIEKADFIDLKLSYNNYRLSKNSQYQDLLDCAKIKDKIPFEFVFDYNLSNDFLSKIDTDKRICIVKKPCVAHMHKLSGNKSMAPNIEIFQDWIDANKENFYFIAVGKDEKFIGDIKGIDLDLTNKTSVSDLIGLVKISSVVATQIGHLVPIAQGLKKRLKVFYPEKITDPILKNMGFCKIHIEGTKYYD